MFDHPILYATVIGAALGLILDIALNGRESQETTLYILVYGITGHFCVELALEVYSWF
jgi:hypothetical protein